MELLKFFTENNLSGHKTKETLLMKNFPDMYVQVVNHSNFLPFKDKLTFREKIWYFIHNETNQMVCKECGTKLKFGKDLRAGYPKYCSVKCMNKNRDHIAQVKLTSNLLYGGNAPTCSKNIQEKVRTTLKKNYGVESPMDSKIIRDKVTKTMQERFNVSNASQTDNYRKRNLINYTDFGITDVANGKMTYVCSTCGITSELNDYFFFYRRNNNINLCPKCTPIKSFAKQSDLFNYIQELLPNDVILKNSRSIIKPKEIDVYVPSMKIGFELNGLYWHSSLFNANTDHQDKQEKTEFLGIKLFQIFEDEWDNKRDIVKSMINNLLGININKIYARQCEIRDVKVSEATEFLNKSHLQGYSHSKHKIGLFYNNELVSIMTFGSPRIISGRRETEPNVFEIIRFASNLNTTVVGGASKLFKYFIDNHNPSKIITYADRRFSTGELYKKLGFEFIRYTQPNYYYLVNNKRVHRFNFNKQKLIKRGFDPNKTEKQIMIENNIYKIFDCGSLLFEKNFK